MGFSLEGYGTEKVVRYAIKMAKNLSKTTGTKSRKQLKQPKKIL